MISDEIAAIVIGRNEGDRLIGCLKSLRSSLNSVIYVDSGSTDLSTEAAEQLGARVVRLDANRPFTAARARNEGFATLKRHSPNTRFVQFIDGDCELDNSWLNAALEFMSQRNDVAVVCGRRRERYPSSSVYNLLCDLEWNTPAGQTSSCGGDAMMRADAFEAVCGFDAGLIAGEEPELCLRLRERGWKIWRLNAEMTRHDAAMTRFGQWWVRAVRWGYAMAEVSRLHWRSPQTIWKIELVRAVLWGGLLPAFVGLAALIYPIALAALVIYPLQVCRVAILSGANSSNSWTFALFAVLARFAEFQGILTFYWRRSNSRSIKLIEYK